jgi:TetR/AcrR family transcriptional regulator, transcriptional repressor for nem operon
MMAIAKVSTRDEIVRKGAALIHARGYKATGIQEILNAAGIPKGSFYFYFKSKDDFCVSVIDYFAAAISETFKIHLQDTRFPPLERLDKLVNFFETAYNDLGAKLGCPIGNLSLELADANEELRKRLGSAVEGVISQIESCISEAQKNRQLAEGLHTGDTARFIFHGLEGALMHMKVAKSIEPIRTFRRYLKVYLSGNKITAGRSPQMRTRRKC